MNKDIYYDQDYVYHITEKENTDLILDFLLKTRSSEIMNFPGIDYQNRLYFANSLIAAYAIASNFEGYNEGQEYIILKIPRKALDSFKKHYSEYFTTNGFYENKYFNIDIFYIEEDLDLTNIDVEIIYKNSLNDIFTDEELEGLYY